MLDHNIATLTDSYKLGHWNQYPEDTEKVYSYFESRKGAKWDTTVFFGLQYLLHRLIGPVITQEKIERAALLSKYHFGNEKMFNRTMWEYILKEHKGCLPVEIKAVPEGTPVPVSNVMMTVVNTDNNCMALTNHLESYLTHVWAPSTVATLSRECKKMINKFLQETSDNQGGLPFMLHDFGFRGVSSVESAGIEGAGHLVNFLGTDTVIAIETAMAYYGADIENTGFSVPATEHSVMTALGREGEFKVLDRLLEQYPTGIISVVSDSYDICNFVKELGTMYKDRILERGGVFVTRPDSLTEELQTPEDEVLWIADQLWKDFSGTRNSKGFKVINPKIRILWGDGINDKGIYFILDKLKVNGYSTENMAAFGMGGGLLQKINRDTNRFAFKSSAQMRSGKWYNICKEPSDKSKTSKKGRLKLVELGKEYCTVNIEDPRPDVMQTVFLNGEIVKRYMFDEIRKNAAI